MTADGVGRLGRAGANGKIGNGMEFLSGSSPHRHDLVSDLGLLGNEEVLPLVRLDRPVVRGRRLDRRRVSLFSEREADESRECDRRLPFLESADAKTKAVRDFLRVGPPEVDQIVVRYGERFSFHRSLFGGDANGGPAVRRVAGLSSKSRLAPFLFCGTFCSLAPIFHSPTYAVFFLVWSVRISLMRVW